MERVPPLDISGIYHIEHIRHRPPSVPNFRILIVDNNQHQVFIEENLLDAIAVELEDEAALSHDYANSGLEALKMIHENGPYDVIIMDIEMPELDGIMTTKIIKAFGINTPIIVCSSTSDISVIDSAILSGADSFISKPIIINEFKNLIMGYIEGDD